LNDLVRDLKLTKNQSELLASRLQDWNLLNPGVKVTSFRRRTAALSNIFSMAGDLCYCNNIFALFTEFGIEYDKEEWRLFIDASKCSIKAVLLHNGNVYPSVPLAHSVTMRENYQNIKKFFSVSNMLITNGLSVLTSKLLPLSPVYNWGTQNIAASFASGIVEIVISTMYAKIGHCVQ
jgi:hypothetical protein